jgi:hypothetical protein
LAVSPCFGHHGSGVGEDRVIGLSDLVEERILALAERRVRWKILVGPGRRGAQKTS